MVKKSFTFEPYTFKNYTTLTTQERKIALEFRNKNSAWMVNTEQIDWQSHQKWIDDLNTDTSTLYYLVFKENIPFISIDFHDINWQKKEAYWGYFLGDNQFKSEVLKIEQYIIKIAFEKLHLEKLLCINDIENHVIGIHKFFGFEEDKVVTIKGRKFLQMYLKKGDK